MYVYFATHTSTSDGLASILHHHRCEPLLRLICEVAVSHSQGPGKDQVWQEVRSINTITSDQLYCEGLNFLFHDSNIHCTYLNSN